MCTMKGKDLLAGAAKSASYNMILQLSSRVLTFALNAFILRYVTRDMLGVVNVRLMLLYSTTVFVSREAFIRACLSSGVNRCWPQIINLLWIIFPLTIIWSMLFTIIWLFILEAPDPFLVPHYSIAVMSYAASNIIEAIAEPLRVVGMAHMFVSFRVLADSSFLALKCIITVVLVILAPHLGLIIFSIAQVTSMLVYITLYYAYFRHVALQTKKTDDSFPFTTTRHFFPSRVMNKPMIDRSLATLTWSFFKQSFLKQILTEGERYVMTIFDVLSFGDQGIYDVINNLGSLAARFVFMPIEESGYLFFSQTLGRNVSVKEQNKDSITLATGVLSSLLKAVTLLGLIIMVLGYAYSYLALDLYGGNILSSGTGPTLLRWYCVYVLIIAINGTTECFVFAAMSQADVDRYNHKMLLFSVLFLASSWYLTSILGSVGFILANCLNMTARITHSFYFINNFYKGSGYRNPLKALLMSPSLLAVLAVAFFVTVLSEKYFCCKMGILYRLIHLAIGGITLLVVLATIYLKESDLIHFIKEQIQSRKQKTS